MAANKTKFTDASVEDYISARGSEQKRGLIVTSFAKANAYPFSECIERTRTVVPNANQAATHELKLDTAIARVLWRFLY